MTLTRRALLGATAAGAAACLRERPENLRTAPPPRARDVRAVVDAQPTVEGAGVHLRRTLGTRALPMLDPFLMLDEVHTDIASDYLAGFPTHPHRGFETVTYVLEGSVEHRDSMGNSGSLTAGSAQWMTAGSGIVHSEMPGQREGGMWIFQFWVNLPRARKMTAPRYQDIAPGRITEGRVGDALARVVAGEVGGHRGPVEGIVTAPQMVDLRFDSAGRATVPVTRGHNAFAYVVAATARVGDTTLRSGQLAVLGDGDHVSLRGERGARMLVVSAMPLGEPVARGGPFVMNTHEEIRQAWEDYRAGRLVQPG